MEGKGHEPKELEALRRDVVLAMREASVATKDLKRLFDRLEAVTRDAVGQIERGTKALDVAHSMEFADRRKALNAGSARLRKGRHNLQLAMFLLAEAEGNSRAEIARTWGVSRQLISRMIMER